MGKPKELKKVKVQSTEQKESLTDQLMRKLQPHPDVIIKLLAALDSKGFFLTLSWYEITDPQNPEKDLQHFWKNSNYNEDDCLPSMRHLMLNWAGKRRPDMDMNDPAAGGFI